MPEVYDAMEPAPTAPMTNDITELEARVDALQRKLNDAVERIEELEAQTEGSSGGGWDTVSPYMNAVLEHTEPGQTISRKDMEHILRSKTNVSNPKTVRGKVREITTMGPFERHPEVNQHWVRQEVEPDE